MSIFKISLFIRKLHSRLSILWQNPIQNLWNFLRWCPPVSLPCPPLASACFIPRLLSSTPLYFSVRLSAIIIWCGVLWCDLPGRPSLEDLPQIVVSNLLPLATACPRGRLHRPRAGSTHLLMFSAVFDHLLIKSDPFLICNLILLPTFFPRLFLYRQIQIIEPRPICPSRNLFVFPLPLP